MAPAVAARFRLKVEQRSDGECWMWKAGKDGAGYGQFWLNGRKYKAHRIAWELHHGKPFPADMVACHSCDNPLCVNPHHIWPGTITENLRDARVKGRLKLPHETGTVPWNKKKTHCIRGHALSGGNLIIKHGDKRACRICTSASKQAWEKKNRAAQRARAKEREIASGDEK